MGQGARARMLKKGYKPPEKERDIVLAILQWLQAQHKDWCWVRCEPPAAHRAAHGKTIGARGFRPHLPEDAWGDGVADILGIGPASIALEVKSATGKQRDSQKAFQERWEKAGGRYYVVRSVEDVQRAMEAL